MTTHPGAQYLAELEASAKKATHGEWREGIEGNLRLYGPDGCGADSGLIASFVRRRDVSHIANASPARIAAIVEYVAGLAPQRMWCLTCGTLTTDRSCHCTEGDGEGPQNLVSEAGELSRRLAAEKARADAAEALAKEEGEARDHWFDLATYEVGGVPQHWKDRAEKAEATISTLTAERDALIRERDNIADANHRQAFCIHQCAAHIGPDTAGTLDGLPKAVAMVVRERDEAREALRPFAKRADDYDGIPPSKYHGDISFELYWPLSTQVQFPLSDLRRARSALSGAKDEREGT